MSIIDEIRTFVPLCPQEERDKAYMLDFLARHDDAFDRSNEEAHMTASAWVVSLDRTRVVMCYHNIYNSWSWTGGHADGDRDLPAVAMREVLVATVATVKVSARQWTTDSATKRGPVQPKGRPRTTAREIELAGRSWFGGWFGGGGTT